MNEKGSIQETIRTKMQACASIEVSLPNGDLSIGTAFHVGDGVYLTARHVVDGNIILNVVPNTQGYLLRSEAPHASEQSLGTMHYGDEVFEIYHLHHSAPTVTAEPKFYPDDAVDVAVFRLGGVDPDTPLLELGGHYDDWIDDAQWLLTEAIIFGYPPIPMSKNATLIVDEVTVNAVVDTYRDRYVRFVVSGVPRGGFSGAPVWHEWGFVLGMITESLEHQTDENTHGYLTVLSIEALRECLEEHDMLPSAQKIDSLD
jgi:hypothetical protein